MIADSDNAHQTVPLTEVDSENRIVVLKPMLDDSGKPVNVGERYGRGTEKPLVVVAHPENRDTYKEPQEPTESPSAEPSNSSHPTTNPSQTGSSPTPTNTAAGAPEKQTTTITFTAGSQTSGQYSDRAEVGARLTDSVSGDPIAHEDVAFDLIGGDGTSTFAATTDSDGVATVGIDLVRGPGSYQLVARYDGTDTREPSADQTGFVIDRDDSILKLKVTHPGSGTKLKARLLDADSGAPLANRDITFVVGGKKVGTKTTSASGRVALKTRRSGGSQAAFRGDDFYIGDSAALAPSHRGMK
jgi:hypothetical protein